jgi:uncharacterized protein
MPVSVCAVTFADPFWAPRLAVNRTITLSREYELLKQTGRLDAFNPRVKGVHPFWDSDTAKWIEAASYALGVAPDPVLQKRVDAVVRRYVRAQQHDGYLNSYFQRVAPDKRWSNLRDMHELYCAGHLMEAAVARYAACGQDDLLRTLCRYADHIGAVFGTGAGRKRGYPGHPEIELALVRLYRATGCKRYLDLAAYFVNERGRYPYYYDREAVARGEAPSSATRGEAYDTYQAHLPVRRQRTADGHAVRACYLYAGMADVAAETGDVSLKAACRRLWRNIVTRRMYVTGGIGSTHVGERFTVDYDLPDEDAYAETCAAIALVFFAQRMLNLEMDAAIGDVLETALYNGVAAGVSRDGQRFFYANRLAVYPAVMERRIGGHHFSSFRQAWFGCACCPPNIARLYASLGAYVASTAAERVALHLYAAGEIEAPVSGGTVRLAVRTDYPWDGRVSITVTPGQVKRFTLCLRLPGWCARPALRINGRRQPLASQVRSGYACIDRDWRAGDQVDLDLPMRVERVEAHPSVRQAAGRIALRRGPIVYCLEACDNGADLADIAVPRQASIAAEKSSLLGGCVVLRGRAERRSRAGWEKRLYRAARSAREEVAFQAVPYCLWDNRKQGEMRVWLREA